MCGRFNVIDNPGLQQLLQDLGIDLQLPPGINLAPTDPVGLIRERDGVCSLDVARWWLTPSWAPAVDQKYAMFNARSETLASSRAFRQPFARQRGIVAMSSFIEWRSEEGVKQPYLITSEEGALAVAALWDVWSGDGGSLLSCTLVTTAAAAAFKPWHSRMPVMLQPEEYQRWLDPEQPVAADDPLFRSELKTALEIAPLSRAVSNSSNKSPEVLQPVATAVRLSAEQETA